MYCMYKGIKVNFLSSPSSFFRKKKKPLVCLCPNCYLLGKEIFVFKLLTLLTWLAGWLAGYCLLAYILLTLPYPAAFNVLLTVGYEDDVITITVRSYLYVLYSGWSPIKVIPRL